MISKPKFFPYPPCIPKGEFSSRLPLSSVPRTVPPLSNHSNVKVYELVVLFVTSVKGNSNSFRNPFLPKDRCQPVLHLSPSPPFFNAFPGRRRLPLSFHVFCVCLYALGLLFEGGPLSLSVIYPLFHEFYCVLSYFPFFPFPFFPHFHSPRGSVLFFLLLSFLAAVPSPLNCTTEPLPFGLPPDPSFPG